MMEIACRELFFEFTSFEASLLIYGTSHDNSVGLANESNTGFIFIIYEANFSDFGSFQKS